MSLPTPRAAVGPNWVCQLALLLLQLQLVLPLRNSYSLAQSGRAASDVGSGRDLFKKFLLFRGLFPQEPPRDNVIVIQQPTPTSSYWLPTTTTTTTTTTNATNTRRWRNVEPLAELPAPTLLAGPTRRPGNSRQRIRPQPNGRKQKRRHKHKHKRRQQRPRQQQRQRYRRH